MDLVGNRPAHNIPAKWPTVRISKIPSLVRPEMFSSMLYETVGRSQCEVIRWSYAPDPIVVNEDVYNIATVTFSIAPPPPLNSSGEITWKTEECNIRVVLDFHFLGFTPLSAPETGRVVVE
jgi:hypothetical protein